MKHIIGEDKPFQITMNNHEYECIINSKCYKSKYFYYIRIEEVKCIHKRIMFFKYKKWVVEFIANKVFLVEQDDTPIHPYILINNIKYFDITDIRKVITFAIDK